MSLGEEVLEPGYSHPWEEKNLRSHMQVSSQPGKEFLLQVSGLFLFKLITSIYQALCKKL